MSNAFSTFSNPWLNKLRSLFGKTLYQIKELGANVNTDGANVTDLQTQSLEIGKTYKIWGAVGFSQANDNRSEMRVLHNGNVIAIPSNTVDDDLPTTQNIRMGFNSKPFVATTNNLDVVFTTLKHSSGANDDGGGVLQQDVSFLVIEELPNHDATTKF